MNIPFLDLSKLDQKLKEKLKLRFAALLEEGVFSGGKEVQLLEGTFKSTLNSQFAIACANGTDALELAFRALGIGPGDEVIVPALTWVSTAEAVVMVGAKPVFWDTDEEGLLRSDWVQAVNATTKAVVPVHLYGQMADMKTLGEKARELGIFVIEDAAQAFGAKQNGKPAGTFSEVGCLSFYPTKNLGALGEAGMCLSQNKEIAEKIRLLGNHGQPIRDEHVLIGRNSRIDTVQAAFLNVMLEDFQVHQGKRKKLAQIYLEGLAEISELKLPEKILSDNHNAHLFVIQTQFRDSLKEFLASEGIGTAIHYPQILPDMDVFFQNGDFGTSRKITREALSLPLNPWLSEEDVWFIVNRIRAFFRP
ncbi:DegT/DnrJ/EryC1/StrS family aminotransferase [Algoriphagus sp. CAU 1675]|uniref:DegT/DnrJ/EryC1/StrS family aminotransferase n=1 Tax=Algoriphagus sp. CAU 1675 TaxID=3032597 RepID=UPI0023DA23C5|nr:DegT/DnrJ/EryC1/StrS family aminotransferase [Algoriphagus sp. CAU 1675]MDF2157122.1 DegT/DnrJ/EryC1/StrS family aminotransferase [Algoriphagus sp. CAU 1675]